MHGHGEVVAALAEAGAALDAANAEGASPLVVCAMERAGSGALSALLRAGADVGAADQEGWGALHWAALLGHAHVLMQLLAAGSAVDARTGDGRSALHIAAAAGQTRVVQALLSAHPTPANPNVRDASGHSSTPLHLAAAAAHAAVARALLRSGADVTATDAAGDTPLHTCIKSWKADPWSKRCFATAAALLAAGADPAALNKAGETPLSLAATGEHLRERFRQARDEGRNQRLNSGRWGGRGSTA